MFKNSAKDKFYHPVDKLDPQAKIVMISAINQRQMVFEAIKNGAKHYIVKPIEVDNVKKTINAALGEI